MDTRSSAQLRLKTGQEKGKRDKTNGKRTGRTRALKSTARGHARHASQQFDSIQLQLLVSKGERWLACASFPHLLCVLHLRLSVPCDPVSSSTPIHVPFVRLELSPPHAAWKRYKVKSYFLRRPTAHSPAPCPPLYDAFYGAPIDTNRTWRQEAFHNELGTLACYHGEPLFTCESFTEMLHLKLLVKMRIYD